MTQARPRARAGDPAAPTLAPSIPRVLAIESSCDETSAAVVHGTLVESCVVASQVAEHAAFGGVVPELASRAHVRAIGPVVARALRQAGVDDPGRQLDAVAVTDAPGLVGALLVGVQFARGLALAHDLPCVGIHHLEAHLYSTRLADDGPPALPRLAPAVALLASGGHTELVDVDGAGGYRRLGGTRDDAAGEAFDKIAKLLGLGYPGGPAIDARAESGDPHRWPLPRAMRARGGLDLSFSGLKTAVLTHLQRHGAPRDDAELADLCASAREAIVDQLVDKCLAACAAAGRDRLELVGGVAANRRLRARLAQACATRGLRLGAAPLAYCSDNAAMVGAAASARIAGGVARPVELDVSRTLADVSDPAGRGPP